jgi:hypothetical protein
MNENSSFLNPNVIITKLQQHKKKGFLIDIENSQNDYFYKKAGEKNSTLVFKIIQNYDLNHSILETIKPYFFTNELKIVIDKYFMEREFYLSKMLGKYIS